MLLALFNIVITCVVKTRYTIASILRQTQYMYDYNRNLEVSTLFTWTQLTHLTVEQIRRVFDDNERIIFYSSP